MKTTEFQVAEAKSELVGNLADSTLSNSVEENESANDPFWG